MVAVVAIGVDGAVIADCEAGEGSRCRQLGCTLSLKPHATGMGHRDWGRALCSWTAGTVVNFHSQTSEIAACAIFVLIMQSGKLSLLRGCEGNAGAFPYFPRILVGFTTTADLHRDLHNLAFSAYCHFSNHQV